MAILIGVLAPNFSKYIEKSRKSKDVYTASQIAEVVNIAFIEHPEAYEAYQNWGKAAGTGFSLNVSATVNGITENYTVDLVASNGTQDTNKNQTALTAEYRSSTRLTKAAATDFTG